MSADDMPSRYWRLIGPDGDSSPKSQTCGSASTVPGGLSLCSHRNLVRRPMLFAELPVDAFSWVLALFGTAVGAGILFLPIQVGQSGFWVLILVAVLIYPTIYLGHSLYALIPSRAANGADFIAAVGRWLPRWGAVLLHLLFIGWLLTLLIAYSISLTNDLGEFLSNQEWLTINTRHRVWLSFCILAALILLLRFARPVLLRILGGLSLLLIVLLCLVSAALMPHWNWSVAC